MTAASFRIQVRFFGAAREAAGCDSLPLEIAPGATVKDVATALCERVPAVTRVVARSRFAVNRVVARPDQPVAKGDEVAVLPPVGGG